MLARKRNSLSLYASGIFRLERLKDVEIRSQSLRLVQVLNVRSSPVKAQAIRVLDSTRIDTALGEDRLMLGGKVLPHHGDHTNIGKVACSQGKVCSRATQAIGYRSAWSFDAVECDRSYDKYGQRKSFFLRVE